MSEYVDAHCHLDLFNDHKILLEKCEKQKVNVISMTNAPCVWQRNQEMAKVYKYIYVALGFHPQLAEERKRELSLFEQYVKEARFIGEVGLDGSKEFIKSFKVQEEVFKAILQISSQYDNKILSIHSRNAARQVLSMIKAYFSSNNGKVILHWYSGGIKDALSAAEYGCLFSVNEKMLQTRSGRTLIDNIPKNKILTETDGPFIRGKEYPLSPLQINKCIKILSQLWGRKEEETKELVFNNFKDLLS